MNVGELVGSSDGACTLGEFTGLELEFGVVDFGELEDVVDGEDGFGDDVEDTVEDHFSVGTDDL